MPAATSIPPALIRKLDELTAQVAELDRQLSDPAVLVDHKRIRDLSIKKAAIEPVVADYAEYRKLTKEADDLRSVASGADADFAAMARDELPSVQSRAEQAIERAKSALVNADDRAVGSVILELRAGTGGDEASLWARDLLDIYA